LFDEIDLHNTAADASHQFATCANRHLVTLATGTASRTFGYDKQHHAFISVKARGDKLPEVEFLVHEKILPQRR
jgi:hypothetical protein